MSHPIVIAYHLIWTAYGWWLPNDPRGSSSHTLRSDVIAELGTLHEGRKAVQPASHDLRVFYAAAADWLRHDLTPLQWTSSRKHSRKLSRASATPATPARSCPPTSIS